METCDAAPSAGLSLNEQTARQVFDTLPEDGVVVAILDRGGTRWLSDPEAFEQLGLDEASIEEFRARVDDGVEPVVARLADTSISMAQLTTGHTNCGYAMVALPRGTGKPNVSHINLLEAYLGQIALIAKLTEKNRQLMKTRTAYRGGAEWQDTPMN